MTRHNDVTAVTRVVVSAAALALALSGLAGCDGGGGTGGSGGSGASGGSGGAGGTGGGESCNPGPSEQASVQKLTVELQNKTAEERYLVTGCNGCDTLRVEEKGDVEYAQLPLLLSAAQSCGCECPDPGDPYTSAVHRISPGLTFTATWDARALLTCDSQQDCGNGQTATLTTGALQPVGPGDYRVSFPVIVNLPAECTENGATGDYTCGPPAVMGIDPGGGFYAVELTFGATGDVMTTLDIP